MATFEDEMWNLVAPRVRELVDDVIINGRNQNRVRRIALEVISEWVSQTLNRVTENVDGGRGALDGFNMTELRLLYGLRVLSDLPRSQRLAPAAIRRRLRRMGATEPTDLPPIIRRRRRGIIGGIGQGEVRD